MTKSKVTLNNPIHFLFKDKYVLIWLLAQFLFAYWSHCTRRVSKLPFTFVFWCTFDSAKFKLLIFFSPFQLFFSSKIYIKRCERYNKTHWTRNFLNSVLRFILVLVLYLVQPTIKFQISHWTKVVTTLTLDTSADKKKKKNHQAIKFWNLSYLTQNITCPLVPLEYD